MNRTGLAMNQCARCGRVHFPRRPVCPRCHGTKFSDVVARTGVVEEVTTTASATIASVRTELGPLVVAALTLPDAHPGTEVDLASTAFVPTTDEQEAR